MDIRNTGSREGDEIAQLYIRDDYASLTRPVKELKDFKRVNLKPGEQKTVAFDITPEKLAFYDANMKWIIGTRRLHRDGRSFVRRCQIIETHCGIMEHGNDFYPRHAMKMNRYILLGLLLLMGVASSFSQDAQQAGRYTSIVLRSVA